MLSQPSIAPIDRSRILRRQFFPFLFFPFFYLLSLTFFFQGPFTDVKGLSGLLRLFFYLSPTPVFFFFLDECEIWPGIGERDPFFGPSLKSLRPRKFHSVSITIFRTKCVYIQWKRCIVFFHAEP